MQSQKSNKALLVCSMERSFPVPADDTDFVNAVMPRSVFIEFQT